MTTKRVPIAQGDVLLIPRRSVPGDSREAATEAGRHILALGESTGHSHSVLANRAAMFVADRPASGAALTIGWLKVGTDGVAVEHLNADMATRADHLPIDLAPGIWEIRRQREWTDENEPRIVAD